MKSRPGSIRKLATWISLSIAILFLIGCQQMDPVSANLPVAASEEPPRTPQSDSIPEIHSYRVDDGLAGKYPIRAYRTFTFNADSNYYPGGVIKLSGGNSSMFQVGDSALVPPDSIPFGADVTIEMQVDFDMATKNMLFTFGPHGTRFKTPARIKLHYRDMDIEQPKLYYIDDDGGLIPQTPDDIDVKQRFMIIYIHHFSRYMLAHS